MKTIIVSVKDKVTEQFLQPIFVHNEEEAKRVFAYQLQSNPLWKDNAEQFEIYNMGWFDTERGTISGIDQKQEFRNELICKGTDLYGKE